MAVYNSIPMMKHTRILSCIIISTLIATLAFTGCATAPRTAQERAQLAANVDSTKQAFLQRDPTMQALFNDAYAYAVFPRITKGGVGVGGAHGLGMAYKGGKFSGYCSITQGTIGAQLGGQEFRQILFFNNQASFDRFQAGEMELAAQASAVAAAEGAAAVAKYEHDIMIFTMTTTGLMFEASVGGQRFQYTPAKH